jgi:Glycosyl hydrolase family 79 C-terminal beta domain
MKIKASALACVCVLVITSAWTGEACPATEATAEVTVHPDQPGRVIPPDFLGFSYEAPALAEDYFDVQNQELMRLLSNLGTGVLRFGGNSVEFTYWSRKGKVEIPDARAVLTPQDLDRLFALSKKTGWPVMLGLNLGHYDPEMAADEAAYAVKQGGADLLALEIGNEPDLFMHNGQRPSTWGYDDFRKEFKAYFRAIRSRTPEAPISGPVTCCSAGRKWFPRFLSDEGPQLAMATFHNYPMSASRDLSPDSPRYPTIPRMLSPELMRRVAKEIHQLAQDAGAHHLPLRMAEVNSASSGGLNGVSNVFAAALWGADYAFTLAEQGAVGLNFHGGFRCRGYTPVCISQGHYSAQPLYYGMLLFHAATPGRLVPIKVRTDANLTAYGVLSDNGTLHLVLINKDGQSLANVETSGLASYSRATLLRLAAPTLDAQTGITLGGRPVDADGAWKPAQAENVPRKGSDFVFRLPAASAAVVKFQK